MSRNHWRKFTARFWKLVGGVSVRTKIFGIVLGSTLMLSLGFTLQVHHALRSVLEQKAQEQGISITRDIAARSTDLILINDLYSIHQLLVETQANFSDVRYAFIVDPQGQVLAHTFSAGFPTDLIEANTAAGMDYQNTTLVQTDEGQVWDVAVPIFGGKAGTARVGISDQSMRQTLTTLTTQLGLTILVVLAGSLLAASLLTWVLTRPILELVEVTRSVARGDFSARVQRWADDEIGDLAEAFNQMIIELGRLDVVRQEREALRKQLLEGMITVQEEERRRISRELHDSTSQSLTSLMIGLRNVSDVCSKPAVDEQIKLLRKEVSTTLDEVHTLAVQLRPVILDDLGLKAALERSVAEWGKRHKIAVDVFVHLGSTRLPDYMKTALYRIIQEALTNIAKHAHAESVSVLVERQKGGLVAVIEDDGQGFEVDNEFDSMHLGLLSMKERAELLDGTLVVESSSGYGTSIYVSIPIASKNGVDNGR
ncbi:MAG: Oxygen sensor histidine kinase NreB [Chloroflexi bacterium]|nr:Oxygen sensor histidine kinase NreB [Chloroflexota bacterium]